MKKNNHPLFKFLDHVGNHLFRKQLVLIINISDGESTPIYKMMEKKNIEINLLK